MAGWWIGTVEGMDEGLLVGEFCQLNSIRCEDVHDGVLSEEPATDPRGTLPALQQHCAGWG